MLQRPLEQANNGQVGAWQLSLAQSFTGVPAQHHNKVGTSSCSIR